MNRNLRELKPAHTCVWELDGDKEQTIELFALGDLAILGVKALAGSDKDAVIHGNQIAAGLFDAGVVASCSGVRLPQNGYLIPVGHGNRRHAHGMDVAEQPLAQADVHDSVALPQRLGRLLRAAQQACLAGVHRRGHYTAKPLKNANARAGDHAVVHGLDPAGNHADAVVHGVFRKNLGIIRTGGRRAPKHALAYISCDHYPALLCDQYGCVCEN